MTHEEFLRLLKKYNDGIASDEEKKLIHAYYNLFDVLDEPTERKFTNNELNQLKAAIHKQLIPQINTKELKKQPHQSYIGWAAASIILLLGIGVLLFSNKVTTKRLSKQTISASDIHPGGKRATLILDDGRSIPLDDQGRGLITAKRDVTIKKTDSSELSYVLANQVSQTAATVHRLVTPVGGQYNLTLADGTKVWLNASSSLKFPSHFSGNTRVVELVGEGYFEVAQNKTHPFIVEVGDNKVEVLGTHFNISAYQNEAQMTTTLLEGAVKVSTASVQQLLIPGNQAVINAQQSAIQVSMVNTQQAVAWKDGLIYMKDESLEKIMRKLARWYDVEVSYADHIDKSMTFSGVVSSNKSIRSVLNIMESTEDIHFTLKGRRIMVTR